jgi:hypothetical protein
MRGHAASPRPSPSRSPRGSSRPVPYSGAVLGQDIDIPAAVKDLVRSGDAQVTISACLGGYANQNDRVDALLYCAASPVTAPARARSR